MHFIEGLHAMRSLLWGQLFTWEKTECWNKAKVIFYMTDREPFVVCGFCGVNISPVIGYTKINIPDIF